MPTDVSSFRNAYKTAIKSNFPDRVSLTIWDQFIESFAKLTKISTVVWPAGSFSDAQIIDVANKKDIALVATLERCFLH